MVPDAAWLGSDEWPWSTAPATGPLDRLGPPSVRPMGCWFFPVPRPPYVCAVSWATWLLFTGVPARCVALRLRCPGPLSSCSPVRPLGELLCLCGILGHLAPVHRCARVVCRLACAVSWATWLLFTGAPAWCVVCTPVNRRHLGQDTAHAQAPRTTKRQETTARHTGEQEPNGPGHRTYKAAHQADTPVNRSQVAQDTPYTVVSGRRVSLVVVSLFLSF